MLLIAGIDIENFGPYYGQHTLEFGASDGELIVVHGENMAGKTSLLNAIRWCLYGVAKDRAGRPIPTRKLINATALDEGDARVAVAVRLLDRDDTRESNVDIQRQRQAKPKIVTPGGDSDFEEHLDVTVDKNIQSAAHFDDIVNALLPERISRFFLFDGELLKEYEELVQEESSVHARDVKNAIEMILGVPAVLNGKRDLTDLQKEAARRYTREARKNKALQQTAGKADDLQDEVERLEAELERLNKQRSEALTGVQACRDELERHQHLREDAIRLKAVEAELETRAAEDTARSTKRRELVKELWRDVIESRLKNEIDRLEGERDKIGAAVATKAEIERNLAAQRTALADDTCATCGRPLEEERKLKARNAIQALEDRLDEISPVPDAERLDELGAVIRRLRDIAPAGVDSGIAQIEQDLLRSATARHKLRREVETLTEKLRGFDADVVDTQERERTRLLKHIGEVESAISRASEALGERQSELRDAQRAMKEQDDPTLRLLRNELDLYDQALAVFESSIDELVDGLRLDVEAEASAIFRELTTDKSYQGLSINENYGLTILGEGATPISVRSAGAEQVVALSLIGALNRLAAKRGPVIMDTPFGRLDRRHRDNILGFVPTLTDQVVLLVHSGELDPERDLDGIRSRISSEYEIEHKESLKSTIRRRPANV